MEEEIGHVAQFKKLDGNPQIQPIVSDRPRRQKYMKRKKNYS